MSGPCNNSRTSKKRDNFTTRFMAMVAAANRAGLEASFDSDVNKAYKESLANRKVLRSRYQLLLDGIVRHTTDPLPKGPPTNTRLDRLLASFFWPYLLAVINQKAYKAAQKYELPDHGAIASDVMEALLKRFKKNPALDLNSADKIEAYLHVSIEHEAIDHLERAKRDSKFAQPQDGELERARYSGVALPKRRPKKK